MSIRVLAPLLALGLAACDSAPSEPAVDQTVLGPETIPTETAGAITIPGFYAISSNGTVYAKTAFQIDGTYVDYDPQDSQVGSGTWRTDGGSICLQPRGFDGTLPDERCWTIGAPNEDASFTMTLVDGSESYLVTPIPQ